MENIQEYKCEEKNEMSNQCNLCPRNCNVNRAQTAKNGLGVGYCRMPQDVYLARAALHYWEEPCISGTHGSGAVFFSGCSMRCVFCQNAQIAAGEIGKRVDLGRLTDIFLELQDQGANNINLVTPTHYVPQIVKSLMRAKEQGLAIPVVYNTSAYEHPDTIKRLEGLVDIYLPDLKYADAELSAKYSAAPDYFMVAATAIQNMYEQVGTPVFLDKQKKIYIDSNDNEISINRKQIPDIEDGMMVKGMIVRHLLLPGFVNDSKKVIQYLYETYGNNCYISIMNQYTPLPQVAAFPELNRKITKREYNKVIEYALDLGVENAFIQEGKTAEESFIPAFNYEGV